MDLDTLLKRNYDRLVDPEVKDRMVSLLSRIDDVTSLDVFTVKRLTKVADHIVKGNPYRFDGMLPKLYHFNCQGAEKAQEGFSRTQKRVMGIMLAHFYGHAADIAEALYDRTGDLSWVERSYFDSMMSGDVGAEYGKRYASLAYHDAARSAQEMFEQTKDGGWAIKCYESRMLSAEMVSGIDDRQSANEHGRAGEAARTAYLCTLDANWAERSIGAFQTFLDYHRQHEDGRMQKIVELIEERQQEMKECLAID